MKKKVHTCLGRTLLPKQHVLCENTGRFAISSKLQEVLCLLAQGYVFEEAEEMLRELLGIAIDARQIQRESAGSMVGLWKRTSNSRQQRKCQLLFCP